MVVLVFQFTRIVSLPIVNAMSNSLGLWTSSVIVVVSPSRQRHAGNGMRQPIMVKSDLVKCAEPQSMEICMCAYFTWKQTHFWHFSSSAVDPVKYFILNKLKVRVF